MTEHKELTQREIELKKLELKEKEIALKERELKLKEDEHKIKQKIPSLIGEFSQHIGNFFRKACTIGTYIIMFLCLCCIVSMLYYRFQPLPSYAMYEHTLSEGDVVLMVFCFVVFVGLFALNKNDIFNFFKRNR